MTTALEFAIVGAHTAASDAKFYDAFDVAVRLEDDHIVVVGLRTADYLGQGRARAWRDGYVPLATPLDLTTIGHFDFGRILWLGPAGHPCVIYSNATGLSLRGIAHLLGERADSRLLDGPDGRGLPTPVDLEIELPTDTAWHSLASLRAT